MPPRSSASNKTTVDLALLVLRLVLGATFVLHGLQKLFGLFGGIGLSGFTHYAATLGMPHSRTLGIAAACAELVGGLLVFLGIATEIGALAILVTIGVGIWKVSGANGFFIVNGGFEYHALILAVCAALILVGPGRWAIWRMGRR